MRESHNKIQSLEELNQILSALFAANDIDISVVMTSDTAIVMDPRSVPQSEWIEQAMVPIPANVAAYIDTHDAIAVDETNAIEIALERFFSIPAGWFIALSSECMRFDQTGDEPKPVIHKPLHFLLCKEPA